MARSDEDVSFEEAFAASDAEKRRGSIPEEMPLDYVRERCQEIERILRLQFKPQPLPGPMQRQLARCPEDGSPEDLVERWVTVSHLLRCVRDDLQGSWSTATDDDIEEAARQLLTREPVEIDLEDRTVQVTGRSYAAMLQMARHETRIDELRADAQRADEIRQEIAEEIEGASGRTTRLRKRHERVGRIYRLILKEILLHRQALYAHALTESGAPAESLEEAPDWWREIGPGEHAALLAGLLEAGPGRLNRLGPVPDRDEGRGPAEDWGYKSLITTFEHEMQVEPASYFHTDLGQLITWMRGGAREPMEET